MEEELDNKLLTSAIKSAESEISVLNQKKKAKDTKTEDKTTYTKTEKKGAVTKKTTSKRSYKKPEEFKDNPIAKSINTLVDKLIGEKGVGHDCEFGECMALVIDYYLTDIPEHPLIYLGMSSGTLLFIALQKKDMIPNLFGKPKKTPEAPDAINRKTTAQMKAEAEGKKLPTIIETKDYQIQKKESKK